MTLSPEGCREVQPSGFNVAAPGLRRAQTPQDHQRWRRIIHAIVELSAQGGYNNVRMRDVAQRAEVPTASVYDYFPSKVHLLVAALGYGLSRFDFALANRENNPNDPSACLHFVADALIDAMERSEHLTSALTHAYVAACVTAIDEGEQIRRQTIDLWARQLDHSQHAIAECVADIWTSAIISLVQDRSSLSDLRARMRTAIHLLVEHRSWNDTQYL